MDLGEIVGGMAQSGVGDGFKRMGFDAMGGNAMTGEAAYAKGASTGLDLVKKRLEARKLRDEAMARDATLAKMQAAFPDMDPEMLDLAANTITGGMGSDFNSTMSGLKDQQYMDLQRKAAAATDPDARNAVLSALDAKPLKRTEVEGGVAFDPYAPPAASGMVITPSAAADDVRQALVADSQVTRNTAAAKKYGSGKPSSIQSRAASLEEDAAIIEREIGRPMTTAERAKYLQTGKFQLSKAEMKQQPRSGAFAGVRDGTDEGRSGLGPGVTARDAVRSAMTPESTAVNVDLQTGARTGSQINPAALQKAQQAIQQGRSKAGVVAKLRAAGFNAEADAIEATP